MQNLAACSEKEEEPDESGVKKDNKTNKGESKNEGSFTRRLDSAEAPNWKITAGTIPQD